MIALKAAGAPFNIPETLVGRVAAGSAADSLRVISVATLSGTEAPAEVLLTARGFAPLTAGMPLVAKMDSVQHLAMGDVVAVHPSGRVDTLYRVHSANNTLFATERCNSKCLMCSQPPRMVDDIDYFFALNRTLVSFLPQSLPTLGMTGGEPTLLGQRLPKLIHEITAALPTTQLEILSNGRAFCNASIACSVAEACTKRVLFTVPLYSDHAPQHDFIVQAKDAFVQTVIGLHNLARFGVRAEIRVVLHRQSFKRLPKLARFIQKNLPFVEHVALMGMEHTGYARLHDDELWIDPPSYADELELAVAYLSDFGYPVSLYNLQPCLVPRALWPYLRTSISDWKREYLPPCEGCCMRERCGGVFGTSHRQSTLIRAIRELA